MTLTREAFALAWIVGFVSPNPVAAGDGPAAPGAIPAAPAATPPQAPVAGAGGAPSGGAQIRVPAAVGGGIHYWGPPFFVTVGPNGPVMVTPPPPNYFFFTTRSWPEPVRLGGPVPARAPAPRIEVKRWPRRVDVAKRDELLTIGDRLFRAGNFKRAGERYLQALRVDPDSATPRVRLAQVALKREDYAEAAQRYRESIAAEPDWLPKANGIQAIYGEPSDFERVIAELESHVLQRPDDRDAWLVLGAQYYLAGRTRQAGDVFLRLTDRKPDATIAAFLDVTQAVK
ncbi:MAG: tetratricopeptide repeat protein [Isosphaeraceae bacterium]